MAKKKNLVIGLHGIDVYLLVLISKVNVSHATKLCGLSLDLETSIWREQQPNKKCLICAERLKEFVSTGFYRCRYVVEGA